MAQTMLLSGVSGHANVGHFKTSVAQALLQRLKSKPFSHTLLPSPTTQFNTSNSTFTTYALFNQKPKAPPAKKVVAPNPKVEDGIFGTSGGIK